MARHANALEVLRKDHREMQQLFQRFEKTSSDREQDKLCREMVQALRLHTGMEEQVFYPYVRDATAELDAVEEASVEHQAAKQLMKDLESGDSNEIHRHAVVKVLSEYLGHHIREEEQRIFPLVEKTGVDLEALGEELLECRKALESGKAYSPPENKEGLSRSTLHAKWIHSPDEHEDHPGQTLATRVPEVIRRWAEERKARPATTPGGDPQRPRVLRLDFPGYDEGLQPVSWEAWLRTFQERNLVFLFQEHLKNGKQSNFFKLDSPEREDG